MDFELTRHARHVITERRILLGRISELSDRGLSQAAAGAVAGEGERGRLRVETTRGPPGSRQLGDAPILLAWVQRTLEKPEFQETDASDSSLQCRYRRIPEFGDRVLRVVLNPDVEPVRVVSVFFDRSMRRKL